jgi:fatty acid-binding protein DegV
MCVSIRVVTDNAGDLSTDVVQAYNITGVPMHSNISPKSHLDGIDMSRRAFYEGLPLFESHPMTLAHGPGIWAETFEELADDGATGLVSIHIGSSLSAMRNSSVTDRAAAQVEQRAGC